MGHNLHSIIDLYRFSSIAQSKEKTFLREISFLFVLSSLLNICWLFVWQYKQITLSVIPMFALLVTLITVYLQLKIGKSAVPLREKLCVHLPFSVYLGWITIAAIADVAAALVSINWNGLGISDVT
jgi:benzodiazapine receptor